MSEDFDLNDNRFSTVNPEMAADNEAMSIRRKQNVSKLAKPDVHSVTSSNKLSRKFQVGSIYDSAEAEADAIADSFLKSKNISNPEKEANIGINRVIRRKSIGIEGGSVDLHTESSISNNLGKGSKIQPKIRRQFEDHIGADFSAVNIHTGKESNDLNEKLNSKAFTTGNDIFFSSGTYNTESDSGKHLLAHELTHVAQNNGGNQTVNRKTSVGLIQREINGTVTDKSQLHKVDSSGKDEGTFGGFLSSGVYFAAGDKIKIDDDNSLTDWWKTKKNGKEGFIRKTKVLTDEDYKTARLGWKESNNDSEGREVVETANETFLGGMGELTGGSGELLDAKSLTEIEGSNLVDKKDKPKSDEQNKTHLDIAGGVAGTLQSLILIGTTINSWNGKDDFFDKASKIYDVVAATASAASGTNQVVHGAAQTLGHKGAGKSEIAQEHLNAIAGGFSALKSTASGLIGIYKLFTNNSDTKAVDGAVALKELVIAAQNSANIAKSVYKVIQESVPLHLIQVVSALSIAVNTIELILAFNDAIQSRHKEEEMTTLSESNSVVLEKNGFSDTAAKKETGSAVFDVEKRGVWPSYKEYFRIKKSILNTFDTFHEQFEKDKTNISQTSISLKDAYNLESNSKEALENRENKDKQIQILKDKIFQINTELFGTGSEDDKKTERNKKRDEAGILRAELNILEDGQSKEPSLEKLKSNISDSETQKALTELNFLQGIDSIAQKGEEIQKLNVLDEGKNVGQNLKKIQDVKSNPIKIKSEHNLVSVAGSEIGKFRQQMYEYEFSDKMREINQKRKTTSYTQIGASLINIAADIVGITTSATGIGAAVSVGMKLGVGAAKAAHGASKFIQQTARNNGFGGADQNKSTSNKHKEYCQHTKFIFNELANLDPNDTSKAAKLETYIKATGVNYGLWTAKVGNPSDQADDLINAMKKR